MVGKHEDEVDSFRFGGFNNSDGILVGLPWLQLCLIIVSGLTAVALTLTWSSW